MRILSHPHGHNFGNEFCNDEPRVLTGVLPQDNFDLPAD